MPDRTRTRRGRARSLSVSLGERVRRRWRWAPSRSVRDDSVHRALRDDGTRRRRLPAVVRRWRRQLPLEAVSTFPRTISRFLTRAHRAPDDVDEEQLRETENEGADGRHHVPVGELRRVVGNTTRHTGKPQEVLREEQHVHADRRQPEVQLADLFVVHATRPLGQPVVHARHDGEDCARNQHVVEVSHDEVAVVILEVRRDDGEHQARETTNREQEEEGDREQHRRLEADRAFPHRRAPVEHFHAGGDCDEHGRQHEEQLPRERHTDGEHVVRPDDEREERDRRGGVDHRLIAEQRLARERRNDFRNDTEGRQDEDVHLGVSEEPEDVLEHHRVTATRGGEEARTEEIVGEQHGDRAREHRHDGDQQVRRDQPRPAEERHVEQTHSRGAHIENGDDDVDRAEDRRDTHEVNREDREREAVTGLQRERRIKRPAACGSATRHEQREQQQREGEREQPEAEVVESRQRHIRRAHLHRHHPVGEPCPCRHHSAEDHQQRVHRRHGIEETRIDELQARLEEFRANDESHGAAHEEHRASEHEVHRADVLMVRGEEPALEAVRLVIVVIVSVIVGRGIGHDVRALSN